MKILKGVILVTTVVLALAAQGSAAMTTSEYYVPATTGEPGLDTGLVLKKGRSVTVTATGVVCINDSASVCATPDGLSAVDTTQGVLDGFLLPGAPAYGLVARVGSGPWGQVGSGPMTLSGTGALVFAVNDDQFDDNSFGFEVSVSYKASGVTRTCWPGWGWGDENHQHCGPPGQEKKNEPASQPTQGASNEHGKSEEKGNPKK